MPTEPQAAPAEEKNELFDSHTRRLGRDSRRGLLPLCCSSCLAFRVHVARMCARASGASAAVHVAPLFFLHELLSCFPSGLHACLRARMRRCAHGVLGFTNKCASRSSGRPPARPPVTLARPSLAMLAYRRPRRTRGESRSGALCRSVRRSRSGSIPGPTVRAGGSRHPETAGAAASAHGAEGNPCGHDPAAWWRVRPGGGAPRLVGNRGGFARGVLAAASHHRRMQGLGRPRLPALVEGRHALVQFPHGRTQRHAPVVPQSGVRDDPEAQAAPHG